MLRISKLTDYGTLVMSQLARFPERRFSASDLATALGLGVPTVSKVLKILARHELVQGVRGFRGGYSLSRSPDRITVADMVDALEEQPFGLTECSTSSGLCDFESGCRTRSSWQEISLIVRRALQDVTLTDLVRPVPLERIVDMRSMRRPTGPLEHSPQASVDRK